MPPVDTRVPLYLGVSAPEIAIVTNDGNVNVYYQVETNGGSTISAAINDGMIVPASLLAVSAPTFFLAAGQGAQVEIATVDAAGTFAAGLTLSDGSSLPADLVAQITGNAADDVNAIGLGTNVALPVEQFAGSVLGNVTGAVQLDLGGGDALFSGIVMTGNTQFTFVNAVYGSVFALDLRASGHTVTHPPGSVWPAGTAPTPSGGEDLYVYLVVGVSNGVPTKLLANYTQAYA